MDNIVKSSGSKPNDIMGVGEAPGKEEYRRERPFVGKSGEELEGFVNFYGLSCRFWYLANVIQEYTEGNPDPTLEQIAHWTPILEAEIAEVRPKLIIAIGGFATKWFLGEAAEMNTVHGCLCLGGEFDSTRRARAQGAYVLPVYHPARGLHDSSARGVIGWDYSVVADVVKSIKNDRVIVQAWTDQYVEREQYWDMTGQEVEEYLQHDSWDRICEEDGPFYVGLDTEWDQEDRTWSIQISISEGTGFVLRTSQPDFQVGLNALIRTIGLPDEGAVIVAHNAPVDITHALQVGLDLRRHTIFDPMYAAYVLRVLPQSLSALSWRLFRGHKVPFNKFVGKAARSKQIEYLQRVVRTYLPAQDPFNRYQNNGSYKLYKPSSISKKAAGILKDMDIHGTRRGPAEYKGVQGYKLDGTLRKKLTRVLVREGELIGPKLDKDGNPPDPQDRWNDIYKTKNLTSTGLPAEPFTLVAERELGPMPIATLADMPLKEAVDYAAKDADYALRCVEPLTVMMKHRGVWELFQQRMKVVEPFREIKENGLLGDKDEFVRLSVEMSTEMDTIREELSAGFFDGQPINPISSKDVGELLKMRGLEAKKTTKVFLKELKSGEIKHYGGGDSTATDSISHLRFPREENGIQVDGDPAIALVFKWRQIQKYKDTFILPPIKRMDPFGPRYQYVTCEVATTRTPTTRVRMRDPGLQAIPTRQGPAIRNCYTCETGEMLVTADQSAIEWVVTAQLSQDKEILAEIRNPDIDPHIALAGKIFRVPYGEVTKSQRSVAKTVRYLMNYGGSPDKLQDELWKIGLMWSMEECERIFLEAERSSPVLAAYIDQVRKDARRDGYVRDYWGMINYLWPSSDSKVTAENGRQSWSYLVSGTAQGTIQNSMAWLKEQVWELVDQGVDIKWRLQLHDELMFSCPEEFADLLGQLIVVALTQHHECIGWSVPIEAEWAKAERWGELK